MHSAGLAICDVANRLDITRCHSAVITYLDMLCSAALKTVDITLGKATGMSSHVATARRGNCKEQLQRPLEIELEGTCCKSDCQWLTVYQYVSD